MAPCNTHNGWRIVVTRIRTFNAADCSEKTRSRDLMKIRFGIEPPTRRYRTKFRRYRTNHSPSVFGDIVLEGSANFVQGSRHQLRTSPSEDEHIEYGMMRLIACSIVVFASDLVEY